MSEIKYGVWFLGNEDKHEPPGICYDYRHPFFSSSKDEALLFMDGLILHNPESLKLYKLCKVEIED